MKKIYLFFFLTVSSYFATNCKIKEIKFPDPEKFQAFEDCLSSSKYYKKYSTKFSKKFLPIETKELNEFVKSQKIIISVFFESAVNKYFLIDKEDVSYFENLDNIIAIDWYFIGDN